MNPYLSSKITALSFFAIVMVVYIHSYNVYPGIPAGYNFFIQNLVSNSICRTAVPLFFLISGYLFFVSIKVGSPSEFSDKFKKRFRSLAIPYLFWALFACLFFLALQAVPQVARLFKGNLVRDYSAEKWMVKIFIEPIAFQLWFIRDLFILVLSSPLIYTFFKYLKGFILLAFVVLWVLDFDFYIFSNESLLFFTFGGYLAFSKSNLDTLRFRNYYFLTLAVWITLCVIRAFLINKGYSKDPWGIPYLLNKVSIIVGILAMSLIFDKIMNGKVVSGRRMLLLFSFSFFIYVFHEPLMTLLKALCYFLLGKNEINSLIMYILLPLAVIAICLITGFLFKKLAIRIYNFSTGNR